MAVGRNQRNNLNAYRDLLLLRIDEMIAVVAPLLANPDPVMVAVATRVTTALTNAKATLTTQINTIATTT